MTDSLPQKFYGMAVSLYPQHILNVCTMVGTNPDDIKAVEDSKLSWKLNSRNELVQGVDRLLDTVTEVAKLQVAENQRYNNIKYCMPVVIGSRSDNDLPELKDLPAKYPRQMQARIQAEPIHQTIILLANERLAKNRINHFVAPARFNVNNSPAETDPAAAEQEHKRREALNYEVKNKTNHYDQALTELKRIGLLIAEQLAEIAKTSEKLTKRRKEFFLLIEPRDQFLNLPEVVTVMKECLRTQLGYELDIKFANDTKDAPFFNVTRPVMAGNIKAALK